MYLPAHFDEPSREVLYELIENNALGVLITMAGAVSTPITQGENGSLYSCAISTRAEGKCTFSLE
ncbi:FMN-binding negative transcriptional regulator [Mesorhizobium sp. M0664]|uniref:FMN-binding negative transcriptional regulator n=1 Tax=Mesorhizobium sp. M0664 TaxID=2956982 RepID=UPI003338CFE6